MSDAVVVDASLALKWVLEEDYTAEAIDLLAHWRAHRIARIAPGWFACEVANVLYQQVRTGELTIVQAGQALADVLAAVTIRDVEPETALPRIGPRAGTTTDLGHPIPRPGRACRLRVLDR